MKHINLIFALVLITLVIIAAYFDLQKKRLEITPADEWVVTDSKGAWSGSTNTALGAEDFVIGEGNEKALH